MERVAWIAGVILLAIYAGARVSSERARVVGIAAIEAEHEATTTDGSQAFLPLEKSPDLSLWSPTRIAAWQEASSARELPQAILRIPSVELSVPVFEGTSETNLNRGAGRIEGTAALGEAGNIGLAAHRDGYFRALKDVRVGDDLQLTTKDEVFTYRIIETSVVEPTAVDVLAPTASPTVTLVTCYPFYFLGSAPQRYIVRAELTRESRVVATPSGATRLSAN